MLGHLLGEWGIRAALTLGHPLRSHFARSRPLRDAKGRIVRRVVLLFGRWLRGCI